MKQADWGRATFAIAAAYVGAVVGAGFASGREIFQFFAVYGQMGLVGALVAGVLLGLVGGMLLDIIKREPVRHYADLLALLFPAPLARALDAVIMLLLFIGLIVVLSAAGALSQQQWGMSGLWGALLLAVALLPGLWYEAAGVVRLNNWLTPLLVLVTLGVCLNALMHRGMPHGVMPLADQLIHPFWGTATVLYVAYNLFLGVTALASLGADSTRAQVPMVAGLLAGAALASMAFLICAVLVANLGRSADMHIPLGLLAAESGPLWNLAYQVLLLLALITTGLANGLGMQARLVATVPIAWRRVMIVSALAIAVPCSQVGLSQLVRVVYPLIGVLGLLFMMLVVKHFFVHVGQGH